MLLQLHEVHKQVKLGKYSFEKHPNVPGVTGSLDLQCLCAVFQLCPATGRISWYPPLLSASGACHARACSSMMVLFLASLLSVISAA